MVAWLAVVDGQRGLLASANREMGGGACGVGLPGGCCSCRRGLGHVAAAWAAVRRCACAQQGVGEQACSSRILVACDTHNRGCSISYIVIVTAAVHECLEGDAGQGMPHALSSGQHYCCLPPPSCAVLLQI